MGKSLHNGLQLFPSTARGWDPAPLSPGMLSLVFLCPAVGIVPPRTKSPPEEEVVPAGSMLRRSAGGMANGLGSKARPLARG